MKTKLVRDKIPEIIEFDSGEKQTYQTASASMMPALLQQKLKEETRELELAIKKGTDAEIINELADIEEVLKAIAEQNKISVSKIEKTRKEKLQKRGGFKKRIVMNFRS